MADNPLNRFPPESPAGDWPTSGHVQPILSSRVERSAKALREKWRAQGRAVRKADDLELAYEEARSANPRVKAPALGRAFRNATSPGAALDATFAALAVATAAGQRPRLEGLLAFLELCYPSDDLDAGALRLGERLRSGPLLPDSPLATIANDDRWLRLAGRLRDIAEGLEPPRAAAPVRRSFAADLGPRRVVVRVTGGLGNQMFQYAAALSYARRVGLPLRLDLFAYDRPAPYREFLLGRLRVPIRRANSWEVLWARRRPHFEKGGVFDDFLFADHGSAWLCGFWENVAYIQDVLPTLKRRFLPRDQAVAIGAYEIVERAGRGGGQVVGVHLRRGDRGPGGGAYAPFSTLPAEYYRAAAGRFPPATNFLVFSDSPDDIAWCRAHLGLGEDARISFSDGRDPILDLFALTLCDHVIISAGTFSWWAGYLGAKPGRRVIAPNPLQALSAERVVIPPTMPPLPEWEVLTVPPGVW